MKPTATFPLYPNQHGESPSAPTLAASLYHSDESAWISIHRMGDPQALIAEAMLDYSHGEIRLYIWDDKHVGADPNNELEGLVLCSKPQEALDEWGT